MGNKYAKILVGILVVGELLLSGGVVFAQTTTENATAPIEEIIENTVPLDETPVPDTEEGPESADLQGASSTPQLQETFSDQETVDLNDTSEDDVITVSTTTEEILPPEEEGDTGNASTTDETAPEDPEETAITTEEIPVIQVEEEAEAPAEVPPQEAEAIEEVVVNQDATPSVVFSREELLPNPKYSFSVNSGKRISAARKVRRPSEVLARGVVSGPFTQNEILDTPPTISVDNAKGVMNISGSCADKYYVILVYKNEIDYDANKRSYIVNRAFPCENGAYSYDIVNLPPTLADGTYYLLVAGMGEDTPWEPITGLSEINLQRNPE